MENFTNNIRFTKKHFLGMMKVLSLMVFITLVSCGPNAKTLFQNAKQNQPYDAIIVPGIPYEEKEGKWSDVMRIRVYWAKYLYDQGITKNIIFSGSAVYTQYTEARVMALYAQALGVPAENILLEERAEHSTENVYYSYYLARKAGLSKVAVATDPFQTAMLKSFPKKMKVDIDFIPMVMETLKGLDKKDVQVDLSTAKVNTNFTPITDRESRFKRLMGTMGMNIRKDSMDVRMKRKND